MMNFILSVIMNFVTIFGSLMTHEGIIGNNEEVNTEILGVWQSISSHRNTDYANKNISTMQNLTIHYFAMFLVNTFFGRGYMGKITTLRPEQAPPRSPPQLEEEAQLGGSPHSSLLLPKCQPFWRNLSWRFDHSKRSL
jgi:hypothetical protein